MSKTIKHNLPKYHNEPKNDHHLISVHLES